MTADPATRDERYRALSHCRRRRVLATLADAGGTMTVRDVATEIVTREHDAPLPDVPCDAFRKTYHSLIHVHVPMLADADLIEYDPDRLVIEDATLADVRPLLSFPDDGRSSEPAR